MDIDKLTASIQAHEDTILYVYDDANRQPIVKGYTVIGNPTIGTGRLLTRGKGISPAENRYLLGNDIQSSIGEAEAQSWWPKLGGNDARENAFIELIFNMGIGGLGTFKNALACLQSADFNGTANALLDSLWSKQVGQRAITLTDMIRTGGDQPSNT